MKYFNLYITLLALLLISCKETNHNTDGIQNTNTQLNSVSNFNNNDGVAFLTEFYAKYYGENRDKKGIEKYVSNRILKRMDSLTMEDNLILDYDPFISGQDWDENVLKKSLEIIPLKNKNEYRVSFFRFNKDDEERTKIDLLLKNNSEDKLLIYSILNNEYLNFSSLKNTPTSQKKNNFYDEWIGTYKGQFLRLKEESADPRAYAMLYIDIKNNEAIFKLDSYKEILNTDLVIFSYNSNEIVLVEKNNKNSKFTITKNNKKYELKSNLLNDTVGEISVYELEKK